MREEVIPVTWLWPYLEASRATRVIIQYTLFDLNSWSSDSRFVRGQYEIPFVYIPWTYNSSVCRWCCVEQPTHRQRTLQLVQACFFHCSKFPLILEPVRATPTVLKGLETAKLFSILCRIPYQLPVYSQMLPKPLYCFVIPTRLTTLQLILKTIVPKVYT